MSDGLIQATAGTLRTLVDGTVRLQVDFNPADRKEVMDLFGEHGAPLIVGRFTPTAARDELQRQAAREEVKQAADEKPYGHYAQALYKAGFFLAPKVLQAIGSDEEFLAWLKTRQCCMKKLGGCHGDIVAAHVRRVSEGAGTGIKPKYSAVPMCDAHHRLQHQKGESALGGKEAFDRKRAYYLQEWASHALADGWFGMESMGYVEPAILHDWCMEHELMQYLPGVYKA